MSHIVIVAQCGEVIAFTSFEVELEWRPLMVEDSVGNFFPQHLFEVNIYDPDHSFIWYPPRAARPSLWRRFKNLFSNEGGYNES